MHEFDCKPSRLLGAGLTVGVALALALAAVWTAALDDWLRAAVTLAVLALLRSALRRAREPCRLRLLADGTIQVWQADDWRDATVDAASFVSPALIVLSLHAEHGRLRRVLVPDSAPADALRRLRVSLRWGGRTPRDTAGRDAG